MDSDSGVTDGDTRIDTPLYLDESSNEVDNDPGAVEIKEKLIETF